MDSISKALGGTIRERRRQLAMSQAQVAALTGKTQSQIARLEKGLGDPRISGVVQVSRSLGMEIMAIPVRLQPAVRQLIHEFENHRPLGTSAKLVGNDPEDREERDDES